MFRKIEVFRTLLIFLGISYTVFATNHFFDKNAIGKNNGSGWRNAWVNFKNIDWSSISPGDTIFISGGNDSTIYNEMLSIKSNGSADKRIVVMKGTDTGHNGNVIIDGEGIIADGIKISKSNYIVIKGIELRNSKRGLIKITHSNYILIEDCRMQIYGRAGVFIQYSTGSEVRNCNIETGSYVGIQTDGIYSQYTVNNVYDHNYIVINNSEPSGHDDCIQSYKDNNLTIHSNYCEQNNNKTSNAQGIYATAPTGGVFRFYNNIVNMGNAKSNGMGFQKLGGTGSIEMIENTLYGMRSNSLLFLTDTDDPVIKNNIIYSEGTAFAAKLSDWNGNPSNINNNLIYVPNSNKNKVWDFNGDSKSWSQWKALGFDAQGKNADPRFKNIAGRDFSLQAGSPAIDAGANLGSPYNIDMFGVKRPLGAAYDIGSFEWTGSTKN